jgi:DMSO/TMAO reductase YedYZ molybdopterin-dependent catalytic subunit
MRTLTRALAGVVAAGFGIAVAELLAAATRPEAGPLIAVGGAVIDATPTPIKEFAVRELGTNDKPALLAGIGVVLALIAAVTGVVGGRHRAAVAAGATVLGVAGAAAALSRPAATAYFAIPALLGAAIAGGALWWLLSLRAGGAPGVSSASSAPGVSSASSAPGVSSASSASDVPQRRGLLARANGLTQRRGFLILVAGAAVAVAGAEVLKRIGSGAAGRSREAVKLPAPADPAPALPAGTGPGFYTPNGDFYRVDTALTVPRVDVDGWTLKIHGMVDREIELTFDQLLARPMIERDITLNCVSSEVGGPYTGTARWLGVPLAALLKEAGVQAGADQLVARSVEGMTIGTPLETALDGRDTMLAVGMNGESLPLEHGFPVRMLTPGLFGYAGACKWVTELEVTTFDKFDAYWVKRGWSPRGTVKTASRIDKPAPFARPAAGPVTVAGVAWAQRRGIAAVEISVDGGAWTKAELLPVPSIDTWVQWRYTWPATSGPHSIAVRATDKTGAVQPQTRKTPFPDGATGWHTITVTVS